MNNKDKLEAFLEILQVPVSVVVECPYCEEVTKTDYKETINEIGDVCDWVGSDLICPICKKTFRIKTIEWT